MIKIIMNTYSDIPHPFELIKRDRIHRLHSPKDSFVFHQGDTPKYLYYLLSGSARLLRHTPSGRMVTLHTARAGNFLAEVSLYSAQYHCDCIAKDDCRFVAFHKSDVLFLLAENPKFAAALAQNLARQIQRYRKQLELRSIQSANERVLAGLSDGWLTSSIMAFSDDLGLTHEATYRALAKLVTQGAVLKTGRGKYRVLGPA
ncbi:MAG: Crp/Fnr family transcriptional regulator [Paracoccaceae bacterium]